ncbi:sentrin-specific protease 6-like isoform X2 [Lethenteron reissneri]|uniref:sentrin-specific protease 6-like isoform X2 n=1 Tax=Lethenteron reissneri TaxID=7753 RepID=UPI002AB74CFD|nr:sentrin-specific protease 6-like isoform X2 [Lethenteron reissneri]
MSERRSKLLKALDAVERIQETSSDEEKPRHDEIILLNEEDSESPDDKQKSTSSYFAKGGRGIRASPTQTRARLPSTENSSREQLRPLRSSPQASTAAGTVVGGRWFLHANAQSKEPSPRKDGDTTVRPHLYPVVVLGVKDRLGNGSDSVTRVTSAADAADDDALDAAAANVEKVSEFCRKVIFKRGGRDVTAGSLLLSPGTPTEPPSANVTAHRSALRPSLDGADKQFWAVCNNCGKKSENLTTCDSCHKLIPDTARKRLKEAAEGGGGTGAATSAGGTGSGTSSNYQHLTAIGKRSPLLLTLSLRAQNAYRSPEERLQAVESAALRLRSNDFSGVSPLGRPDHVKLARSGSSTVPRASVRGRGRGRGRGARKPQLPTEPIVLSSDDEDEENETRSSGCTTPTSTPLLVSELDTGWCATPTSTASAASTARAANSSACASPIATSITSGTPRGTTSPVAGRRSIREPSDRRETSSPVSGPCSGPCSADERPALLSDDATSVDERPAAGDQPAGGDDDYGDFGSLFQMSTKSTMSIKARMKNKFGQSPVPVKRPRIAVGRRGSCGGSSGAGTAARPAATAAPSSLAGLDESAAISLVCRMFRVGTLKIREPCLAVFSEDGLRFEDMKAEALTLAARELTSFEMAFSRTCSMLFIQTTSIAAQRFCHQLNMSRDKQEWFNPTGNDPKEMYIILVLDSYPEYPAQKELKTLMEAVGCRNSIRGFCRQIKTLEANQRLILSTAGTAGTAGTAEPAGAAAADEALASSSSAEDGAPSPAAGRKAPACTLPSYQLRTTRRIAVSTSSASSASASPTGADGFSVTVEKLVVFPPPPAKGAISVTSEDLSCLNPGEFLNDVIIDFYLKYLVMEKLAKADSEKIHIFSSFFYKRLNQRDKSRSEEAAGLTLPQRRHRRVRTWTRHVDIFAKDFVFVPINETSHWFLAIICFPGLQGKCYVPKAKSLAFAASNSSGKQGGTTITPTNNNGSNSSSNSSSSSSSNAAPTRVEVFDGSKVAEEEDGETESQAGSDDTTEQLMQQTISLEHSSNNDSGEEVGESEEGGQRPARNGVVPAARTSGRCQRDADTVCKQPCIVIMDSLKGSCRNAVAKTLREYLEVEWFVRRGESRPFTKDSMRYCCPKVPQQDNFSDCGVYLLQYVESFFESPVTSFELPLQLENWFPQERVKRKRTELQQLILLLHHQLQRAPRTVPRDRSPRHATPDSSGAPSPEANGDACGAPRREGDSGEGQQQQQPAGDSRRRRSGEERGDREEEEEADEEMTTSEREDEEEEERVVESSNDCELEFMTEEEGGLVRGSNPSSTTTDESEHKKFGVET